MSFSPLGATGVNVEQKRKNIENRFIYKLLSEILEKVKF